MIRFNCDYCEGAHERILRKLAETNLEQTPGYGEDHYCAEAAGIIRSLCGQEDAAVHFLVGGTQANTTVIAAALRPWQGVLSAESGHIAFHETGAIEASGHKILTLPSTDGTITGDQVDDYCREHFQSSTAEHAVQPGMVYISFPTERGTLYSKSQLTELSEACRRWKLPLFLDGARLGYGLASPACDLTLADLAQLCDVFYIGGTKCGALFGEAVVITHPALKQDFRYNIKQRGGMLAKGRLLGLQFETLFTDDLYLRICRGAVEQALAIRAAFEEKGIAMAWDSPTNQQFPILTDAQAARLQANYVYEPQGRWDQEHLIARFCTSWGTRPQAVESLIQEIREL